MQELALGAAGPAWMTIGGYYCCSRFAAVACSKRLFSCLQVTHRLLQNRPYHPRSLRGPPRRSQRRTQARCLPTTTPPSRSPSGKQPVRNPSLRRLGVQVSGCGCMEDRAPAAQAQGLALGGSHDTTPPPPGGAQAGVRSIMKQKEEPTDPEAHRRSLQFVGVNGR